MNEQPKEYTNEIPYDDLQFIIGDLYGLLEEKKKEEAYEICSVLSEVIASFEQYSIGQMDYSFVMGDLFTLCCNRYTVYSIRYSGPKRFVIFVLPNTHFMFFYMDEDEQSNEYFAMAEGIYQSNKNMIDSCIRKFTEQEGSQKN